MNDDFITEKSNCLTINKCEYLSQLSFSSSRIRQDKKIELDMKQEYSGRELYEMIQNADDEGSPRIELELTEDNYLHIKIKTISLNYTYIRYGFHKYMERFYKPNCTHKYSWKTV